MDSGNVIEIHKALQKFKTKEGAANFTALFEIKNEDRLPALFKEAPEQIAAIISTALTIAFEDLNLARPMNGNQILRLSLRILDSSNEDNLALEDVALFLQKLTNGDYGKLYESMDMAKFMEMFEIYREERYQSIKTIREEQNIQHKAIPIDSRMAELFNMKNLLKRAE